MAKTPAQQIFERKQAAKLAAVSAHGKEQTGTAYELTLAALVEARRELHDVQSIERKIELKRHLLPDFMPYVDGVVSAGLGAKDVVVSTILLWLIDVGEFNRALPIAEYALEHGLESPDNHKRTLPAILAEETADFYLRAGLKLQWHSGEIQNKDIASDDSLAVCAEFLRLTHSFDMHDQIRAKLHKVTGYFLALKGDYNDALEVLARALELDASCGVKKDLERITSTINRILKAKQEEQPTPEEQAEPEKTEKA